MGWEKIHSNNVTNRWKTWCSVAESCLTLCEPEDCSTPGFPVHHHLPEFAQIHGHRVGDANETVLSQKQGMK